MTRAGWGITIAGVCAVALLANAQSTMPGIPDAATLRGESLQTRKRLIEAEQKLLNNLPTEAADDLQRILDECGDDLISLDNKQFHATRYYVHALLAKLPPDALKAYQDRIHQPARQLLEQAQRERDPRPLWQLLDRYFVSRPTEDGLLLLGDLLFERGDFRLAETIWRRLLPDGGADLAYPRPQTDPAVVRARLILAIIFQNDIDRAQRELTLLQTRHPNAHGTLAGHTGPLAKTLQRYLDSPPQLAAMAGTTAAWRTFGGDVERSGRVPHGIPHAWPARPTWTQPDEGLDRPPLPSPSRTPFGHPVIYRGEIFVANGTTVLAFDLHTGKRTRPPYTAALNFAAHPAVRASHCTLTVADGLLYARIGPPLVRPPEPQSSGRYVADSAIVCLSLKTEGKFTELWKLFPPEDDKVATAWEGAPVVHNRRLWAVYAKFDAGRITHTLACYDPADTDKPPVRPQWTVDLCENTPSTLERSRHELLTLAGRNLVFSSNNGAIVAVDATTGRRRWAFRYPRTQKALSSAGNDPAPAVASDGRVFVAPVDGECIYAFDAESGRLLWESASTENARILGIARRRLIVAVAGPYRSLRGLNLETGSHRAGGWVRGTDLLTHGQGIVSDQAIVWPSREGLYLVNPDNGLPYGEPLTSGFRNPFGHVAYAEGMLVVVMANQIWAYRAQNTTVPPRPDASPRERFDIAMDGVEAALTRGQVKAAIAGLAELAASDLPPPFRAMAAARMVQLAPPMLPREQWPDELRKVLQPELLREWILTPDGMPVTLEQWLNQKLGPLPTPSPATWPAGAVAKLDPPNLSDKPTIRHTIALPPGVFPLQWLPGSSTPQRIFAAGAKHIIACPLDRSPSRHYATADIMTHVAEYPGGFVATGPFAVALYGTDPQPLWVFRLPVTERLPQASPFRYRNGQEPDRPHLSSFTLAGGWLVARWGERHLIAWDLEARRVAWVLNAEGTAGYEPYAYPRAVQFGPQLSVCDKFVVVQRSDGKRWFVDRLTGRPMMQPALGEHTALTPWLHPPPLAGSHGLLFSDGPGLVRYAQIGRRVLWSFETEYTEGFTGEPAQVRVCGQHAFVAIRRNHGVEIERINMTNGQAVWSNPVFVDTDRLNLAAATTDTDTLYLPTRDKLVAVAQRSGKTVWERELPDCPRGWTVTMASHGRLLVYPTEAITQQRPQAVFSRWLKSFRREPLVWRLPGWCGTLYDAWMNRCAPVWVVDALTGQRLAHWELPARGPIVTAAFSTTAAVFATGDRIVWLK
ncbi:MAG: PQQ-binding-like beta-propeller repeat protein [Gemmataceae bacterium]|nr:PQQ-binding-like beta-propeller repeat protein [Gemmata sp.]MDW8197147.1 PQQ-binding-like beta-propeller repeat protein [Gemmataceae bacterium]